MFWWYKASIFLCRLKLFLITGKNFIWTSSLSSRKTDNLSCKRSLQLCLHATFLFRANSRGMHCYFDNPWSQLCKGNFVLLSHLILSQSISANSRGMHCYFDNPWSQLCKGNFVLLSHLILSHRQTDKKPFIRCHWTICYFLCSTKLSQASVKDIKKNQ